MEHVVKAPTVGESITEVRILKWLKGDGAAVKSGELLVEIETDKASVEVAAESSGALKILKTEGTTVPVGETLAVIDDAKAGSATASPTAAAPAAAKAATPAPAAPAPMQAATAAGSGGAWQARNLAASPTNGHVAGVSPSVRRMSAEAGLDIAKGGAPDGGRIRKEDLLRHLANGGSTPRPAQAATAAPAKPTLPTEYIDRPGDRRVEMTRIRAKIAERLVHAQHTAAILTTFNEVDLSKVIELRTKHKDSFQKKYGVKLGFMSFFTRAVVLVLKEMPEVNASIDGKDVVFHDYYDIGIAVGTERGLVVPVIRDAHNLTIDGIEKAIGVFAEKAKTNKISLADMAGGTFTISNGGTYGSLLSTPILNPPQSAILGMHKTQDRPVVVDGKIEIRPMMYLALSYDHRLIDGKGAVTFLVKVRELLENPEKLGLEFLNA